MFVPHVKAGSTTNLMKNLVQRRIEEFGWHNPKIKNGRALVRMLGIASRFFSTSLTAHDELSTTARDEMCFADRIDALATSNTDSSATEW
jgi:hypothetical protein